VLKQYRTDQTGAARRWLKLWEQWWTARNPNKPWTRDANAAEWKPAPANLVAWEKWGEPQLAEFDGMVWYRATLTLTKQQVAQSAVLSLGAADEVDLTWVNGEPIGSSSGPQSERKYALPRGTLKAGENAIVVNVLDTYSNGGLVGPSSSRALQLADGSSLALDGKWTYQIAPESLPEPPRAPWEPVAGVTMIYNAMIAPIGPYGIKGVLWYQGESNTASPHNYEALLHAWMADWRRQFGAGLPFLIVQLANHGPASASPRESEWATLRDAQRRAVEKDGRAGLAVAIDIGDRYDIHPANKQEVGRRLARAARRVVYGESIAPSGPVATSAWRDGSAVVVAFRDVERRLVAYSASGPIGFELCGAEAGSCRYVTATLQKDRVLLAADDVSAATRVRYCWADSPVCTLYDESRLPAGPFELAVRQKAGTGLKSGT
jgi:sialate O-acetylesterase